MPRSPGVAIVGYAAAPAVRHADVGLGALTIDTALRAVADAGLTIDVIDGFATAALFPSAGAHVIEDGRSVVTANWLATQLGADPAWVAGFQGYGQLPGSVILATQALLAGSAEYVLLHRALHNPVAQYSANPMTEASGHAQWTAPQGVWGPIASMALTYNEYAERYGATREALAAVVVELRRNGAERPWSYWRHRPLATEDYMAARMIAEPLCLFDCDIPVDTAAAFVLTTSDRAADLPHRPVYVAGYAQGFPSRQTLPGQWPLDDIAAGGERLAARLWSHSGLRRDEIDLPMLYDGFSPYVYFWLEALGYCARGEAHEFVLDGGIDTARGLPVALSGGSLGNGRMHGLPQMLDCYLQLAGRAGERQRHGVTTGLACHSSPHFGGAVAYTTQPR